MIKVNTDAWVRKLICGGKTLSTIKAKGTNIKVKSSGVFLQILQLYIIPQVPKSFSPLHSTCNLRRRKKISLILVPHFLLLIFQVNVLGTVTFPVYIVKAKKIFSSMCKSYISGFFFLNAKATE